jgi:hypothetical protein
MSLLKIKPFSIDLTDTFTFANANVTGNIISGNANLGNLTTSNYFVGNGSLLTSITGSNISGQVGNALVAGTVYGAAQSNITSLGTLTGLTSGGIVNFTSSSNVALGAVGNVHITGGTAGYFLQTDGSGGLSWAAASAGTGNANIAGSNTQIFFNDAGSNALGAKSTFTFDKTTDTLNVTNISANGAGITYIAGANVNGNVTIAVQSHYANIANSVAGANVSGAVAYATTANSVAGANVSGAVAYATTANSVAGANVSGTVAQATYAGTANSVAGANVSGEVTYAATANSVSGANVSGTVAQATYAGTANSVAGANVSGNVSSAVQSHYANIANSVAGANVSGNVTGAVQAHYANIANSVAGSNVSGEVTYAATANSVAGANVSGNVSSAVQSHYANIANSVAGANVSGNVTSAVQSHYANIANSVAGSNVSGNVSSAVQSHYANIANSVSWSNVTSTPTTISGYGITDAYSNTNAGAYLVSYSGDLSGANLTLTGNLVISGTTTSVNSTVTQVVDPIFELGGGANGAALSNDDGKDRGTVLHYYTGGAIRDAFMGWDSSNAEFGFGSAVTVASEVVTFTTYGNVRSNYFLGNGSQLTGVSATSAYSTANGTSNVNIATASGNITMGVGGTAGVVTITTTGVNISGTLNSTGNLTAINAALGNLATANFFTGNGSLLTSITGANVSGNVTSAVQSHYANIANSVAGANVSGNVTSAVQSHYANIANSVAGANVSGEVTYAATANAVAGANVSGQVGNALVAGTVYTAAQTNITSLGTLTGLTSGGTVNFTTSSNVTLGAVGNLHISGGSANYYLQTDGSGALSWAAVATTSMNVDTFTGDGSWTMKTLTATPTNINYTLVAIGGVFQPRDAYSVTTNVVTFDDPPPNGAIVEVTTVVAGAGGGGGGAAAASWTYSAVSANTSAVAGYRYIVDTATANLTITLPASGTLGDEIMIIDGTGNSSSHAITVDRNGGKIQGAASNMTVTTDRAAFTLVYYNSTQGWLLTNV